MTFSPAVEAWRAAFSSAACDLPTDFVLDWLEKESAGNPCNLETATGQDEIGLVQMMVPNDTSIIGIDESTLRANCDGQSQASSWSDSDNSIAVQTSVDYIRALRDLAHQDLQSVGTDWDESTPDFWSLVRLKHAEGIHQGAKLAEATQNLGRPPASYDEFIANSSHSSHWAQVAAEDGSWAAGFQPTCLVNRLLLPGVLLVGLALGALLYERRTHRRVGRAV